MDQIYELHQHLTLSLLLAPTTKLYCHGVIMFYWHGLTPYVQSHVILYSAQKMKFSNKDFLSKYDQIRRKLAVSVFLNLIFIQSVLPLLGQHIVHICWIKSLHWYRVILFFRRHEIFRQITSYVFLTLVSSESTL